MDELMREVEADPSTLGLVLHGSRASGVGRPDSDFDLVRVVTEWGDGLEPLKSEQPERERDDEHDHEHE
jgi:predicted nucleotidyltransferase